MTTLLSTQQGIAILAVFAIIMFAMTAVLFGRFGHGKEQFLVAGRKLGQWETAFSVAATWIWAPALFVSSQKAYTQGLAGVFWFTVPNVACLIIFAYFAGVIRQKVPDGFTLSGYIRERYSERVQNLYLLQLIGLAVCSFAVQLLAGGLVFSFLTGWPFWTVTAVMAVIALAYSMVSGLKASVVTDYIQMLIILGVAGIAVPWAVHEGGGLQTVLAGLGGKSGAYGSIFNGEVAYSFGIAVTIGLLAGPFGDQSFWQRAFAADRQAVRAAFVKGALIFAIVPVTMSFLGFLAAGQGMEVADASLVNLEVVISMLPAWFVVPFTFMLISGLVSTLDSNLCSVAALAGHDVLNRSGGGLTDAQVVRFARGGMVVLALAALAIANIPGMKILYLFLFYGTLRASTLLPTVMSLLSDRIREEGIFWGIVVSIGVGLPLFAYAQLHGMVGLSVIGSLVTVLSSGVLTAFISILRKDMPVSVRAN